jgi:hypothetical protein
MVGDKIFLAKSQFVLLQPVKRNPDGLQCYLSYSPIDVFPAKVTVA